MNNSEICSRNASLLRPRQNGRYFVHDIFTRIFLNEIVSMSVDMPLKFITKGPI